MSIGILEAENKTLRNLSFSHLGKVIKPFPNTNITLFTHLSKQRKHVCLIIIQLNLVKFHIY